MKLRIVQDHDAIAQPWFRLEQFMPASEAWHIVTSGQDREKIKERMERIIDTSVTENRITVLEERET